MKSKVTSWIFNKKGGGGKKRGDKLEKENKVLNIRKQDMGSV